MSRLISTCYISAPAGANLQVLRECLDARGIRVLVPEDLELGSDWASEIKRNIQRADLVIGVLSRARQSQWVLFELGQAWAAGRQIILISPPGTSAPTLRRFLVLRTKLTNRSAIEFGIDQLLASPDKSPAPLDLKKPQTESLGPSSDQYLDELAAISNSRDYRQLESLISRALDDSGVEVISESEGSRGRADRGIDFAIWSDALQPFVGNPLLVQVKFSLKSGADARAVTKRFAESISAVGGRWGLLVYLEGPEPYLGLGSQYPTVLAISVRDLLTRLRLQSFDQIVRDMRNKRVHGGAA
jgi:hypothetical protein